MSEITELQLKLDAYKSLSTKRLAELRKVDAIKKDEYELRDGLVGYLNSHPEVNGVIGTTHKGLLKESDVIIVEDYNKFFNHLKDTDQWDLAQVLKPSTEAVKLRLEEGESIPGLATIKVAKLSVTKL